MEGNFEVLKSIATVAKIHRNSILDFWRIKYDIKEALEHAQTKDAKIPSGFHGCNSLYVKEGETSKLLEAQMPRFMIIKVKVDEQGRARVFQNTHTASAEDLKAIMVCERPFKNWEQVALKRIEQEESKH